MSNTGDSASSGKSCLLRRRRLLKWTWPSFVAAILVTGTCFLLQSTSLLCLRRSETSRRSHSDIAVTEWVVRMAFIVQLVVSMYSYTRICHFTCNHVTSRQNRLKTRLLHLHQLPLVSTDQESSSHAVATTTRLQLRKNTDPITASIAIPPRRRHPRRLRMDMVTSASCFLHTLLCVLTYLPHLAFVSSAYETYTDDQWASATSFVTSLTYLLTTLGHPLVYLAVCKALRDRMVAILLCARSSSRRKDASSKSSPNDVIIRVKFITVERNGM